ncbi:MAG: phosphoribosyltransferase family protein [Acidimicrobiia bacterium]
MSAFRDRHDAGRQLAFHLEQLREEHPVVVGLPRGGVPVAYEVANALGAPLDVIVVRKLGVPFQPELGMGALGEDGVRVLNERVMRAAGVTDEELASVEAREAAEVTRRARSFRGDRPMIELAGRTVIIVDDGLATGGTARAAIQVARAHGARRVVLAVPVAPQEAAHDMADEADRVVVMLQPRRFSAVGQFYADFTQTSDEEVIALLAAARAASIAADNDPLVDDDVVIPASGVALGGRLTVPVGAIGCVVFAHGSGSSRHSSRNRSVARALNRTGLGTLLFDLLTDQEATERMNVFDVDLLASRLYAATAWLAEQPSCEHLPVGYFGASTGAAAALWAAAEPDARIGAIVSRGGRPDLAWHRLDAVHSPTLLIVGGDDTTVLELNRDAARRLGCEHHLEVVAGATHLFEEPGAMERVADLAALWFVEHLSRSGSRTPDAR